MAAAASGLAPAPSLAAPPGAAPLWRQASVPRSPSQLRRLSPLGVGSGANTPAGTPGAGGGAPWDDASGGGGGSKDPEGLSWQPYGLWQQQKERLLRTRGQHGSGTGSGIPATWDPADVAAAEAQAQADAAAAAAAAQAQAQAPAPGSPFSQYSAAQRGAPLPPLRAGTLAAATAALAAGGADSPAARSVRAAGSVPQSPVLYSPESLRQRQLRQQQQLPPRSPSSAAAVAAAAAARGASCPASPAAAPGAAVFAAAAAAAAASPMHVPGAVAPSPPQLSPESTQLRQQQRLQLAPVRVPPADVAAAEPEQSGAISPGSQRQRQVSAARAAAVSQLQLQRLMSERQQDLQSAAEEEEAAAEAGDGVLPPPGQLTPTSRYAPPAPAPQQLQQAPLASR